ncbi:MAG: MmcQ/YjbR family DNA-binding protein [Sphingomonas phyllosphaerae]|uniref:MmcQ/YjbR family DNA-binding protein n=1 Tax=Sphingomonas phyllosphaerae TaxID=257003 RepID=UPI002FF76699
MTFHDWDDVAAFAMTLPDVAPSTSWGQPAMKVRGKLICSTGHEPGSFHVTATHDEKAVLIDSDPDTFWQTPHYANWPGLLVRYGSRDPERVRAVIARAWWDRATRKAQAAYGPRP